MDELDRFEKISEQYSYRKDIVLSELEHAQIEMDKIEAVVGRGGLVSLLNLVFT